MDRLSDARNWAFTGYRMEQDKGVLRRRLLVFLTRHQLAILDHIRVVRPDALITGAHLLKHRLREVRNEKLLPNMRCSS